MRPLLLAARGFLYITFEYQIEQNGPGIVAQIEFHEWTAGDRLRHTNFVGLRDGRGPLKVVRESASEYPHRV